MSAERYEKLDRLGAGGMGEVWKAYDRRTGCVVAVKYLRPEWRRPKDDIRFAREVRYLKRIQHSNVVRFLEEIEDEIDPAYIMEYCPYGNLDNWLSADRSLTEKLDCIRQVCGGVQALHREGIVHRDLKPTNILIGADRRFKVSDLGLSLSLSAGEPRVTTSIWIRHGYCSPEQREDMSSASIQGDIFSIGAILYHMLTGSDCASHPKLDDARIPKHIANVLEWMLANEARVRFPSIETLLPCLKESHADLGYHDLSGCQRCGGVAKYDCDNLEAWYYHCLVCGADESD